jgi:hypothetical protein
LLEEGVWFFFVIQIGVSSTDGTLRTPLDVVPFVLTGLPLIMSIATRAAAAASTGTGLYTVPLCQPARMYWTPAGVAS